MEQGLVRAYAKIINGELVDISKEVNFDNTDH